MGLIDLILNGACVLLWFNWRSAQLASLEKSSPVSLAATLKKAEPRRSGGWLSLAVLVIILAGRSLFYWTVGSTWNWTPSLELGVISLPFRCDFLGRSALFSCLSFALLLGCIYAWLLLISAVNRTVPADVPFQKLVRVHLGRIDRWPAAAKVLLPMALATLSWGLAHSSLAQVGMVPAPVSRVHVWEQAFLLGLSSFLIWKSLIVGVFFLYTLNSYVYLGKSQFWEFINTTGANLLRPLRRLPVCIGKLDLAPILGIGLVFAVAHWAGLWLPRLFQRLPL